MASTPIVIKKMYQLTDINKLWYNWMRGR